MANSTIKAGSKLNKGTGNVKALTKSIPKPTGSLRPGKSISKKATGSPQPKMLERRVPVKNLASEQPHQAGPRGHYSYKA